MSQLVLKIREDRKVWENRRKVLRRRKIPQVNNNFKSNSRYLMTINWDRKHTKVIKKSKRKNFNKTNYRAKTIHRYQLWILIRD